MRKSVNSIMIGLVIISIGIILLGNNMAWWEISMFFEGWWTLFIIIPSIAGLFQKESFTTSALWLIVGILLFLASRDIIDWSTIWQVFFPIVLIFAGLSIAFKPKMEKEIKKKIGKKDVEGYVAIFSGCEEKVNGKFQGANSTAIFGGVDLDLSDAIIEEDIIIEAVSIFGGIDIKLPSNVKVKLSGVPVFGGTDNKYKPEIENGPTVYVNYVCVFGGVDIK